MREILITLKKLYRKDPPKKLNKFGIPENTRYRTADICKVLGISPDLFRWRIISGKYPEVKKDGRGGIFTLDDIETLVKVRPRLDQQKVEAAKKRWRKGSRGGQKGRN
jgi:hypothetical protein